MMQAAHTILCGAAAAQALQGLPALGAVTHCALLRRGFNEMDEVHAATGRYAARLSALRARPRQRRIRTGLARAPGRAGRRRRRGRGRSAAAGPEGTRLLTVFRHVEGLAPETPDDFAATGAELARLHRAARG